MRVYVLNSVEYEFKEYNDDDDGGTLIDRKLIIFNNMNTNSRFNYYGATAADANTAAVVVFALVVAEFYMRTYRPIDRSINRLLP